MKIQQPRSAGEGTNIMKLYLQIGYGMKAMAQELVARWGGTTAILSPRDLEPKSLKDTADVIQKAGGAVLLDPQCYAHDADHPRLKKHTFWKKYRETATVNFSDGGAAEIMRPLLDLNDELGTSHFIVPGQLASDVGPEWFAFHESFLEAARAATMHRPLLATIALGADAMKSEDQIESIIDRSSHWDVDGYYLVAESPSSYLVDEAVWLANLLILAAGLKLQGALGRRWLRESPVTRSC